MASLGEKTRDLLRRERAGQLNEQEAADVKILRDAGKFPPALTGAAAAYERVIRPITEAVETGATMLGKGAAAVDNPYLRERFPPQMQPEEFGKAAGELVPQNLTEAGTTAATIGAGMLTGGMGPLAGAAVRTGAAALGGAGGAYLEGKDPLAEGVTSGALTGVAEGATYLGGKMLRSGLPLKIARDQTAEVGRVMNETVKSFPPLKTGEDLVKLARDPDVGRKAIGDFYDQKVRAAVEALPSPKTGSVPVSREFKTAGDSMRVGENYLEVPSLGGSMTLPQAVEALKNIGHAGFGGGKQNMMDRTMAAKPARETWQAAISEIEGELGRLDPSGRAMALFREGRTEYAKGSAWLQLLRKANPFIGRPNETLVDMNKLREGAEKALPIIKGRLTPEEYRDFVQVLYKGGPIGSRDAVSRAMSPADAASQLARSGGGTGTVAVLGPRTIFPGLGNQYTGRPPYTLPAAEQTLLDLILQRAGGSALSGQ